MALLAGASILQYIRTRTLGTITYPPQKKEALFVGDVPFPSGIRFRWLLSVVVLGSLAGHSH